MIAGDRGPKEGLQVLDISEEGGSSLAFYPLHQLRFQPHCDTGSPLVLLPDLFRILTGSAHLAMWIGEAESM